MSAGRREARSPATLANRTDGIPWLQESEGAELAVDRPSRLGLLKRSQARQIRQLSRAPGAAWCRRGIVRRPGRRVEAQGGAILGAYSGPTTFHAQGR